MSEAEKFEAQGRAHAALKQSRSTIATIQTELTAFSRELRDLAGLIDQYVKDPLTENAAHVPLYGHLRECIELIAGASGKLQRVEQLRNEALHARELQKQVDQF